MKRRIFLKSAGCFSVSSLSIFGARSSPAMNRVTVAPTLPPALRPGMRIGVPAPASGVSKADFESKLKSFSISMNAIGLELVIAKSVMADGTSFLAAPDEVRAAEFMEFVTRPDIHGIICMRGGYGLMRILPLLDYDAIRENPKIICGYSDITALINTIYSRCNLLAFHGPIAAAELDDFTRKWFLPLVYSDGKQQTNSDSLEYSDPINLTTVSPGKARGRIVGGNLTLITSLMGTPYDINTEGSVLFLEDVGEKAYRIDRMLTQMWLAGKLQSCKAIVLGQFTETEETNPTTSVQEVLGSRLSNLNIPILGNFPIGHVTEKFTMPIGAMSEVDADNKKFSILEPTVRV